MIACAENDGPDTASREANVHACAIRLGRHGVLIEGLSGSGKTSLAFGLIEAGLRRGMEAAFVADDRTILTETESSVMARAPTPIFGQAEIRGYGIVPVRAEPQVAIALVVRLVTDEKIERMPEPAFARPLGGLAIPLLLVPRRHEAQAVRIVMAFLARETGFVL
jgi:serine kinase of HPr protein (carbohydrate metabolism regulator)